MVKLDWEIESDRVTEREHQEDEKQRKGHSRKPLRLLLAVLIFLGLVAASIFLIEKRMQQVTEMEESLLFLVTFRRLSVFSFLAFSRILACISKRASTFS